MGLHVVRYICKIANLHIKHIANNTFRLLITPTIRSIHIQTISGQFVQSYSVRLEVAGSGDGVHESDMALFWSCCGRLVRSGCGLRRIFVVHKTSKVCRNYLVSYDFLSSVNAAVGLH